MQNNSTSWYVARGGKAQGPTTSAEIESGLKSGVFSTQDFIFREGEKEWKKLSEYSEFSKVLAELSQQPVPGSKAVTASGAHWVLLVKNLEDTQIGKPRYVQSGPFNKETVLVKIRSGEARWGDFVWKQGFDSWEKLSHVQEFNSTLEFLDEKTQEHAVADERAMLLANVLTVPEATKRDHKFNLDEHKPAEAKGENLALNLGKGITVNPDGLTQEEVEKTLTVTMSEMPKEPTKTLPDAVAFTSDETTQPGLMEDLEPKALETDSVSSSSISPIRKMAQKIDMSKTMSIISTMMSSMLKSKKHNDSNDENVTTKLESSKQTETDQSQSSGFFTPKRVMLYGGTFVAIGIILSISLLMTNPSSETIVSDPSRVSSREVANVTPEQPVQQPVTAAPAVVEKPAAPAPVPKFVKIVPLKLETSQPQIVIESNTGVGEAIQVRVFSKEGQILELVRFDRKTQLARQAGEVPTLNLSKWALPTGSYTVEVKSGEATTNQQIFIGQKNRQFQTALDKHNKKIASQRKVEKKEIEAAVAKVDGLANVVQKKYTDFKKSPSKWKEFYKGWSKDLAGLNKGLLASYKPSKSDKFVYPAAISGVRESANDLFKAGRAYNEALKSKRAPASSVDIKGLRAKLKQIKSSL